MNLRVVNRVCVVFGEQRRLVWSLMDLGAQLEKGALARGKQTMGPPITSGGPWLDSFEEEKTLSVLSQGGR